MESPGESVGSGDVRQLRAVRLRRSADGISTAAPGATLSIRGTCTGNFLLTQDVTLQAAAGATLNGGGTGSTLTINGGTDTIRGLTITGGVADFGGGIHMNEGSETVNLVDSTVRGNTATFVGGGIGQAPSTLNLVNSTVSENTTQFLGGGIASFSATLNLNGSIVSGNSATAPDEAAGGGIEVFGSTATLNASTVGGNTSGNNGAGIDQEGTGGTLTVNSSTVSENSGAGGAGGINNFGGALALTNSSVDHNTAASGGGIFNDSGFEDATLTINHSTVSFNRALGTDPFFGGGGGITNFAELGNTASVVATHLTMTGNTAPAGHGGAIANQGGDGTAALVTIAQSTIGPPNGINPNSAIIGGGIYNDGTLGPASVSLQPGTIVAHNQAASDGGGLYNTRHRQPPADRAGRRLPLQQPRQRLRRKPRRQLLATKAPAKGEAALPPPLSELEGHRRVDSHQWHPAGRTGRTGWKGRLREKAPLRSNYPAIQSKAMPSYRDLLQAVKAEIEEANATRAQALLDEGAVLVDVRERDEWEQGRIPGAVHVPRGNLESRIEQAAPDRSTPVLLYCAVGNRSAFAAKTLAELGYERPVSLAGGYTDWQRNGLPTELPRTLGPARQTRYSRHLLIPEVGEEGQLKLLDSRILLIGAGGLGSPASLYLAAAGVGRLGIVDADVVDETNLQRQIVHSTNSLGEPKVDSARRTIEALNPDVEIVPFRERLTSENIDRILEPGWDVIVDGADNFPTRYLVNDASIWHDIPVVHGSIFRFEGQVTVFKPGKGAARGARHQEAWASPTAPSELTGRYDDGELEGEGGPCYRCLFPQPPPPDMAPSCAEGGVLGVLPGVVGSIQATEALKLALGIGDPLVGRLLLYDALSGEFQEMKLRRDPSCPVCGESPTITDYIDYVEFCAGVGH